MTLERKLNKYRGGILNEPIPDQVRYKEVIPEPKKLGRPRTKDPKPELVPLKRGRPTESRINPHENVTKRELNWKGQPSLQTHFSQEEKTRIFEANKAEIFHMYKNNAKVREVAVKFNVNERTAHNWRQLYRDFILFDGNPEPALIADLKKKEINKFARENGGRESLHSKSADRVLGTSITRIDDMRIKGLDIINMTMDRLKVLIDTEESVGQLAKVMSAVLPYVATKKGEKQEDEADNQSMEQKRAIFVQNVLNVYQHRTPEEQAQFDEAARERETQLALGESMGLSDEDIVEDEDDMEDVDWEEDDENEEILDADDLL